MTRCQRDSGSMYDCQPVCNLPATTQISYIFGHYGPMKILVCDVHVKAEKGRIYPYQITEIKRVVQ